MALKEKTGLGVLFRTVSGRVETEEELQASLDRRYRNGRVAYVRVGISSETCLALLDYAREYEARDIGKLYGFVRPLYQEGAGCSAYSMAFFQLGGLVEPFMEEEWVFDVRVPMRFVGGETNPERRVRVLRLAFASGRWADEDEPHLRLNGWDPTMAYHSIEDRARRGPMTGEEVAERRGKAWGIVLDRRDVPATELLSTGTYFAGEPRMDSPQRWLTVEY